MTELACHQLQIGSWALRKIPEKVMGHGAITYWKDGRDVYDNVSCVYVFDDGVKMTFDSVISINSMDWKNRSWVILER